MMTTHYDGYDLHYPLPDDPPWKPGRVIEEYCTIVYNKDGEELVAFEKVLDIGLTYLWLENCSPIPLWRIISLEWEPVPLPADQREALTQQVRRKDYYRS